MEQSLLHTVLHRDVDRLVEARNCAEAAHVLADREFAAQVGMFKGPVGQMWNEILMGMLARAWAEQRNA